MPAASILALPQTMPPNARIFVRFMRCAGPLPQSQRVAGTYPLVGLDGSLDRNMDSSQDGGGG